MSVFAVIIVLTGCSSPVITGMKVHMQNQEFEDMVHLADSVIADGDSLNAEIWFWRGRAQTSMNQWIDAAESFSRTHQLDLEGNIDISEYWFVFFNAAAWVMNEGDIDSAVDLLEQGIEVTPGRPDFHLMLGDVELNVNQDHAAALAYFQIASDKAMIMADDLQAEIDDSSDPYTADYYVQNLDQVKTICIQALFNSGSILSMMALDAPEDELTTILQQAKDEYYKALEIDPTNVDVLEAIADTYMLEGEYSEAVGVFDQASEQIDIGVSEGWLTQDEADALKANMMISKGYAYIEMEEYDLAINELNEARTLIGEEFIVLSTLAHAHFVMESYDEALTMLDHALLIEGLTPNELANAYYIKFACFSRKEMDIEAAEALEMSLEFQPDNARYWELLASTYSRLGRRNDAIAAMEKAEELR